MSIFTKIFSGEGTSIINSVGGILDNLVTTKAEKQELSNEEAKAERNFILEQKKLGIKEHEMYLHDAQNARDNETKRDTSEHSSWLSKNIHEIIALAVFGAWITSLFVKTEVSSDDIMPIMLMVGGYLFGRTKPQS